MTNQPPSGTKLQPPTESGIASVLRQISLDWWAVLTALALAILVLIGLNVPW